MKKFRNTYNSNSNRLKHFDYTQEYWYYITICTKNNRNYFGHIKNGDLTLNHSGKTALGLWKNLPEHFPLAIDEFIIMPNHMHGIIILDRRDLIHQVSKNSDGKRDLIYQISTKEEKNWVLMQQSGLSLGKVIRYYKAQVTRTIRSQIDKAFSWQSNYYEHIIRNEEDLRRIRSHIQNNPLK